MILTKLKGKQEIVYLMCTALFPCPLMFVHKSDKYCSFNQGQ